MYNSSQRALPFSLEQEYVDKKLCERLATEIEGLPDIVDLVFDEESQEYSLALSAPLPSSPSDPDDDLPIFEVVRVRVC